MALILQVTPPASAENIDPANDDSQYAYAENVGWINAEPSGDGGPGVQVDDLELTGWMWGENIGWASLSCENTVSCATVNYGVSNDGCGSLSGYGWGENVGWLNFSPTSGGVTIDPATGDFSGEAWSENVGWITFASTGPNPYEVRTSWIVAAPSGPSTLSVAKAGANVDLSWTTMVDATEYDVVRGDLTTLRNSNGDYSTATLTCEANNHGSTLLTVSGTPASGEGAWFLIRGANCGGVGTYDSGGTDQVGLRDVEIAGSGNDCH